MGEIFPPNEVENWTQSITSRMYPYVLYCRLCADYGIMAAFSIPSLSYIGCRIFSVDLSTTCLQNYLPTTSPKMRAVSFFISSVSCV